METDTLIVTPKKARLQTPSSWNQYRDLEAKLELAERRNQIRIEKAKFKAHVCSVL
jgi:hypothetical protein